MMNLEFQPPHLGDIAETRDVSKWAQSDSALLLCAPRARIPATHSRALGAGAVAAAPEAARADRGLAHAQRFPGRRQTRPVAEFRDPSTKTLLSTEYGASAIGGRSWWLGDEVLFERISRKRINLKMSHSYLYSFGSSRCTKSLVLEICSASYIL